MITAIVLVSIAVAVVLFVYMVVQVERALRGGS